MYKPTKFTKNCYGELINKIIIQSNKSFIEHNLHKIVFQVLPITLFIVLPVV